MLNLYENKDLTLPGKLVRRTAMALETLSAADYHRATSYRRGWLEPHALDWANQPDPFKRYPDLMRLPLDRDIALPVRNFFDLAAFEPPDRPGSSTLDQPRISALLMLTQALTARSGRGSGMFHFRSVASAGALYPFEIYLAAHRIEGIDPGLYHYDVLGFSLSVLRRGSVPVLPPLDRGVAATVYIAGIFFRSAWKYRSRAYRYVLLDAGHLLENLRLALRALDLDAAVALDFDDTAAASLLGIDPDREACLACVHVAGAGVKPKANGPRSVLPAEELPDSLRAASRVSKKEIAYPDILMVHRGGFAAPPQPPANAPMAIFPGRQPHKWIDLPSPAAAPPADHATVLRQRRSHRNFINAPLDRGRFVAFVQTLTGAMGACSGIAPAHRGSIFVGILSQVGDPVPPGIDLLQADAMRLGRIADGRLAQAMAAACLDQMWLRNAAIHVLFMTDLAALDRRWGARGYRYAMMEAGRLGQNVYLTATALGLGACGIGAVYDREAAGLIGLNDSGALLYLVAVGPPQRR
jgi:SagB-type dehydrogenase family enzyme